jgi:two-component system phosphate regulon sensor histidine kinase PhoR
MLLDDISELSRIETGALQLKPTDLRLDDFLSDLLDNLKGQTAAREVRIRYLLPTELEGRIFQADPLRLTQLLENLLSNAIKFSPAGGTVTFDVRTDGPWLVWTVADQGPGISTTDAQRVFERFYRAPSVRAIPGTGLGLAIVKHLALLMGGEVELQSELGKGASFTFRLPGSPRKTAPAPAPPATPEAPCPVP